MVVLGITQRQKPVLLELILLISPEYVRRDSQSGETEFLHSDAAQELPGVTEEVQVVPRMVTRGNLSHISD